MQLSQLQMTGRFKDLINQQKAQILENHKPPQQKFDILAQLKQIKCKEKQDQADRQVKIKQADLPKLMKRIYSEKKLKVNCQQKGQLCEKSNDSISKYKLRPVKLKTNHDSSEVQLKIANVASTDRFQTEVREKKDYLNYTFGTQFRLRAGNISHVNCKSMIDQKRSTSQTSRVMTTCQQRVVNKIFS